MATIDVDAVLSKLTLEEKVALTSGSDFWHTVAIPRLNVPSVRVSDGPNGVRGTRFFDGVPAACLPCGTGLAATWDVKLLSEVGNLLALEAKAKGVHAILGPTVNIQRSPLGGRGFESYSEDPLLSGLIAAAYINGAQSQGIMATIKHFVCNDQEHERMGVSSIVTDRALREIYLLPFMLAIRDAKPGALMTSYNRLNGTHCSENTKLLDDILRREWGFDGLVMSDWFGTYSTSEAILAGLNLEMPGPSRWRGAALSHAVANNKVPVHILDERVRTVLEFVNRAAKAQIPKDQAEGTRDEPEDRDLIRRVGADSIVLLKNEAEILPLSKRKTVAVIGPNAQTAVYCGGGSASLLPYYAVSPLEGIKAKCRDVRFQQGSYAHKDHPLCGKELKTSDGRQGVIFRAYKEPATKKGRKPVDEKFLGDTYLFLVDYAPDGIEGDLMYAEIEGFYTPDKDCEFEFGLSVAGTAKLYVDDKLVIDNATKQTPGDCFFGCGASEKVGSVSMKKGHTYRVVVDFGSGPTSTLGDFLTAVGKGGFRLGGCPKLDPEDAIYAASLLAAEVDQVVVIAGLNGDWESEGYDRANMDLPKYTDDLISNVLNANPNAVIVIQSGTPVSMPWVDKAKALLHAWYGGNETGNAIADVLFGDVNPSGKLPLTFPKKLEDCPSFLNFGSENGRVLYGEDIYVGYRYYEKANKEVVFPFGHGLSYTTFSLVLLSVAAEADTLKVRVEVTNTGSRDGKEIVQVYVAAVAPSIKRPYKELKGFQKVAVRKHAKAVAEVTIPLKYATSFWDEKRGMWKSEKGEYEVLVGDSSADAGSKGVFGVFRVEKTTWWKGL